MGRGKMQRLKNIFLAGEFDAIAIQEWNKFWPEVPTEDLPHERLRGWFKKRHINLAYNRECKTRKGTHLHGGTGIISVDDAACRVKGIGRDPSGMGRWCFTRYQGKGGRATRFYSAYRPCKSVSYSAGVTVYNQQIAAMVAADDLRCPRLAFMEDLQKEISSAHELGDLVVIGADLNTDITSWIKMGSELDNFIHGLRLTEAILSRHDSLPHATYILGSAPIDSILELGV